MVCRFGCGSHNWRAAAITGFCAIAGLAAWHAIPSAMAQATPPAAAPAAPPPWTQGRPPELANSPLHPHIPSLIGTPAKDIPVDKLQLPPGFKVEIWAADLKEARSLTLGDKGTVFVGNRLRDQVLAVVIMATIARSKSSPKTSPHPTASPLEAARSMSPNASASSASTTSRTSWTSRRSPRSSSTVCRSKPTISGNS